MKVSRYEVLLKIIELGTITAAASYYNYTQSAISQLVSSLEADLGVTLLTRSRSGTVLTMEGEFLFPYIRNIADCHDKLAEQLTTLASLKSGSIRIGAFSSVSCYWLPSLIADFRKQYPDIRFDILQGTYSEIESWLINGLIDLGFVSSTKIKGLDVFPICDDPMMVIIPEDHPLAKEKSLPYERLQDYPFIYITDGDKDVFQKMSSKYDIQLDIQYRVKDDYTVMAMVQNGLGIVIT